MTAASRATISLALATTAALTIALAPGPVAAAPRDHRTQSTAAPGLKPHGLRPIPPTAELRLDATPARAATSMLATTPAVPLEPCVDDPSWLCGSIAVPFDRSRPGGRQQSIAFAVLPHSDSAATATDALFMSTGGPGASNIADRGFLQFLAEDLVEERDMVVIDHRGTGQSNVIDCDQLQQADFLSSPRETILREIGRCGRQLGDGADRYGGGDVARDLDAVRAALGYDQISFYGLSYGGVFVAAYAARFREHLRAAIVDSGAPVTDPRHTWMWGLNVPEATAAGVALDCFRAPACAAAQPRAASALDRLAARVRQNPVAGVVDVSAVGPRRVVVDERALIALADGDWRNVAELAAAAQALDRGDKLPLLRLAGEFQRFGFVPDDLEIYSAGNNAAALCNDADFVWDRTDPVRVRKAKYQHALAELARRDAFDPYSTVGWDEYYLPRYCTYWPKPNRFTPAIPHGTKVTDVPTLILSGDRDTIVPIPTTREYLRVFPNASFLPVAGAGHTAAAWSECAFDVFHTFVRDLDSPSAQACTEPGYVVAAASAFPELARGVVPAVPAAGDGSTLLQRRVVAAAVLAVRDGWVRSFKDPASVNPFSGLRGGGGTFNYDGWPSNVLDLEASRYVADVSVTGESVFVGDDNSLTFTVEVDGPGQLDGTLTGKGLFGFSQPYGDFQVTGTLNGSPVRASVPAN